MAQETKTPGDTISMKEAKSTTLWINKPTWGVEINLHFIIEEMKEHVDDGITDWNQIKAKILAPFSFTVHQNPNNPQNQKDHALAATLQLMEGGWAGPKIISEVRTHFNNYCTYLSQQTTPKATINTSKDDEKQQPRNPRATMENNWCIKCDDGKNSQQRIVKLSSTDKSNKRKFSKILGNTTPETFRRQSSVDLQFVTMSILHASRQVLYQQRIRKAEGKKKLKSKPPKSGKKKEKKIHNTPSLEISVTPLISQIWNSDHKLENISDQKQEQNKSETILKQPRENSMTEELSVFCDDMMDINELQSRCEPFQRVAMVLKLYQELLSTHAEEKLCDIIQNRGVYGHQQLHDDFMHIKIIHIDADNNKIRSHDHSEFGGDECKNEYLKIGKNICKYFIEELQLACNDMGNCPAFSRHYQRIYKKNYEDWSVEDRTFLTECDKIHIFFFHSTIQYGIKYHQTTAEEEATIGQLDRYLDGRIFSKRYVNVFSPDEQEEIKSQKSAKSKLYIGKKEDDLWWNHIQPDEQKQNEEQIYRELVEKMGVFRWQNPHGFETGNSQQISHFKPKFKNVKQEALCNKYESLSSDSWNQTLRKSKIFFDSWARRRISTKYKGYYHDQVTGDEDDWIEGETVKMEDVVILKLYTDFDKLQFALKKCFRFEIFHRILQNTDNMTDEELVLEKDKYDKIKEDLKNRLENFYHWRSQLLIVLNKFGTKLNSKNNMILYHGVNAKMIFHPTQTYAFNGPLSTTVSYHVARTFSTAKGMVLTITSHFPRLNYCNAFDASLISDYPEEQEWLVGFMYVRLLKVRTRKLVDNIASFDDFLKKMNLSSMSREKFFAIHLFKSQIFSMSEHLERILAQYLKVNRCECCDPKAVEKYKKQHDQFKDWDVQCMCSILCKYAGHTQGIKDVARIHAQMKGKYITEQQKKDWKRNEKLSPMIWQKFNEIRMNPNIRQRIKFDEISDHLKRFFMEEIKEQNINTGSKKWIVSFEEITTVYPSVKEIHFINQYRFDDNVLKNLIKQIDRRNNEPPYQKINTIEKIVFLYYNYKNTNENDKENKPLNNKIFTDPDKLNEGLRNKLETKEWIIKHGKNGDTGYKIRIYCKK